MKASHPLIQSTWLSLMLATAAHTSVADLSAVPQIHGIKEQRDERMAWWRDAKFGMFIHWGVYAVPAGEHQGVLDAEWIMRRATIPVKTYRDYAKQFTAENYDPRAWVDLANSMSGTTLQFPVFPEPGRDSEIKPDTIPTFAYNWCVSPFTPMGVAGVIWVPGQANLGYASGDYTPELEILARSLPATYGLEKVPFLDAQPSAALVPGITPPKIENSKSAEFDQWPKSLRELAAQLGAAAGK